MLPLSPRRQSDIWHQMPRLGPVWRRSFCSVSTSVGGLSISPPSPWACLSMFLFGSYKLWFLFGIWESLLHLLGPAAPVWCNLPEAFGALHTPCWSLRPPSRPHARFDRGWWFLLQIHLRSFPDCILVSRQWSHPVVPDCLDSTLARFMLSPLLVSGPLLSPLTFAWVLPVQWTGSPLSSFSLRCALARYHILLLVGPLSLRRGVLLCCPPGSRCSGVSW